MIQPTFHNLSSGLIIKRLEDLALPMRSMGAKAIQHLAGLCSNFSDQRSTDKLYLDAAIAEFPFYTHATPLHFSAVISS